MTRTPDGHNTIRSLARRGIALRFVKRGSCVDPFIAEWAKAHDPIPDGDALHLATDLLDDSHRLVSEHVAGGEERPEHIEEVQIGTADRGRGDAHDGIRRCLDDRIGYVDDLDPLRGLPGESSHPPSLRPGRRVQNGSIHRYLAFSFTALVAVLLVVVV